MNTWLFYLLIGISALSFLGALGCLVALLFSPRGDRQAQIPRQAETPPADRFEELLSQFISANATEFNGLYEGLYQAAYNPAVQTADAYVEWCDRVDQLAAPDFALLFRQRFSRMDPATPASYRSRLLQLLSGIHAAGIERDRETGAGFTADEAMRRAYLLHDGRKPALGAAYITVKPAWLCGESVIEQGLALPAVQNQ